MKQINNQLFPTSVLAIFIICFIGTESSMGQKPISSDTIIRKNLSVNQGFELKFVDCPGAGYGWSLSAPYDSTVLSVRQKSSELMKGNHPVGGHYVRTYYYKVLSKKNITLVYYYQRPWLQDNVYKCKILIRVK